VHGEFGMGLRRCAAAILPEQLLASLQYRRYPMRNPIDTIKIMLQKLHATAKARQRFCPITLQNVAKLREYRCYFVERYIFIDNISVIEEYSVLSKLIYPTNEIGLFNQFIYGH
jgi:hypothetical protein